MEKKNEAHVEELSATNKEIQSKFTLLQTRAETTNANLTQFSTSIRRADFPIRSQANELKGKIMHYFTLFPTHLAQVLIVIGP